MKFTKGYWMNLPGVTNTDAVQVREVKVENDRVYLYTVPYHADMRAMGGPLLEMYISSPQPDIIRTEAYHFMGSNQKMPAFELNDAQMCIRDRSHWVNEQSTALQDIRDSVSENDPLAAITVAESIMVYYRTRAIDLCAVLYDINGTLAFG